MPYISTWGAERDLSGHIIVGRRGIVFADESPLDRDTQGALWRRMSLHQREGKPQHGGVHPQRQRRAMQRLLCQVCAGPSDQDDRGTLWLLETAEDEWEGWPNGLVTSHPPMCLACAPQAVRYCPNLRNGYVALRVAKSDVCGVHGPLYHRGPGIQAVPGDHAIVLYDEPQIRWVLAEQSVRELQSCTIVDL
ncbi:hypothetical protein OIU91_28270 [Streptomyces sp. NBC_01456]|uniref:hypothetical protein n=1 Tax=unclassified Streptomyces TaxID=2593676 RepID=UPI002E2EC12A|nr:MULTISPECIES: hypothetical protein [unclassified Streptomyces]